MAKDLSWRAFEKQIQGLSTLGFNYDEKIYHASQDKRGWNVDRYHTSLASEPIGEPVLNGPFEASKSALALYQFSDTRLVQAYFDPELPIEGRNMLLLGKFAGFTFPFGVRVTAVIDEMKTNESGQSIKVWGYSYRTLQGHFEIGEINFLVSKNIETGEVFLDIAAYSKPDRIPNFFYRIGFKLFGRMLQKYFANSSMKRLQEIAKLHQA